VTVPAHFRGVPRYTRDALPLGEWKAFRKKAPTPMVRITGPFVVETDGGPVICNDGWLAKDSRGRPYPIAAAEQEASYEPTGDDA
jgi:hypothetical protein